MIEKDPSCSKLYHLHIFHVYKCDLNFPIGLYFRKLKQNILDRRLLNDVCCGGWPKWRAIDPFVVDVTQTEKVMVTRHLIIWCNNDLTQCFDQIICYLDQINNQAYGIPLDMVTIIEKYLEEAIYCIKTGMGLSDQHYSHCKESSIFGTVQVSIQLMDAWGIIVS